MLQDDRRVFRENLTRICESSEGTGDSIKALFSREEIAPGSGDCPRETAKNPIELKIVRTFFFCFHPSS